MFLKISSVPCSTAKDITEDEAPNCGFQGKFSKDTKIPSL
jgi:hypothetical protein